MLQEVETSASRPCKQRSRNPLLQFFVMTNISESVNIVEQARYFLQSFSVVFYNYNHIFHCHSHLGTFKRSVLLETNELD